MFNRRDLLRSSLALTASPFIPMTSLAADTSGGYKALVCVFFKGGFDSHDMLIGTDQPSYNAWASARQSLIDNFADAGNAIARDRTNLLNLVPDNAADFGSRQFGMPQEMIALHDLFQQGKAAIVPNVGPLIEPATRQSIDDGTVRIPSRLQSHNDQQSTWQSFSGEGSRVGWGGLMLDLMAQSSPFTAVSAGGEAVFLSGNDTRQTEISRSGNVATAWATSERLDGSTERALAVQEYYRVAGQGANNPMMRDIIDLQSRAVDNTNALSAALDGQTLRDSVVVDGNSLSEALGSIANMIAARDTLGINRQVFYAQLGGFDTHNDHATRMPSLMTRLSEAIASFTSTMESIGLGNQVTLFTASDFGRTLTSNPSGTDHGWGGHQIVAGGAVRGRNILGGVPEFGLGHPLDFKRGSMIPEISVDQYGAELARWFGLNDSEADFIFPNRTNFDRNALQIFA
ncbi:MAG: DUF1501 domain-containing protein [Pseudomonadota bacterium]